MVKRKILYPIILDKSVLNPTSEFLRYLTSKVRFSVLLSVDGKTVKGRDGERVAGKCHHPRGRRKILLRHMFLCRYVNPRVSLDGIDVFRVGHWGCFCQVQAHIPPLLQFYTTSWKSCTSSVVGKTVCVVVRRIYLVSQTTRIVAMPLCCFSGSPRDASINVTEDYVSFCRNGKIKRERGWRWNELRNDETSLFRTIEFRYRWPIYCTKIYISWTNQVYIIKKIMKIISCHVLKARYSL